MKVIVIINGKGGCTKSTVTASLSCALIRQKPQQIKRGGYRVLMIDLDPQADITEWFEAGTGLGIEGTLVEAMQGGCKLSQVIKPTKFDGLDIVASTELLEELGREITVDAEYPSILANLLLDLDGYDFVVLDSPNQISPIMENAIFAADLFIVPFESSKAVKRFANLEKLLLKHRGHERYQALHLLSGIALPGMRTRVVELLAEGKLPVCPVEIRYCGWLSKVDEHGGNIFEYRQNSKGAHDMTALANLVVGELDPFAKKVSPAKLREVK